MFQLSFSTVLMAVLFSNIIIALTAICFCHKGTLISIGYKVFAVLLGITLLRIIFPVQFSFTTNIVLPQALSKVIVFLRYYFYQSPYIKVSIWNIFKLIWAIGIVIKLVKFIKGELAFYRTIQLYGNDVTDKGYYSNVLKEICTKKYSNFRVIELNGLKVPILYGIRHPRILIPAGVEIPQNTLRYLLSHETAHYYHHDILTKAGAHLLTIIYWWNPACYLLQAQLDAVLEMRIDNGIAGNTFESKFGYLNCLVYVAELGNDKSRKYVKLPESSIALYDSHTFNNLINRFHILGEEPKPYARPIHLLALAITVALYLFSYLFIFEAYYVVPQENTFGTDAPNIYAVLAGSNTYEIYYGGVLMETVNSLENHNEEMAVYNSLNDVPDELRVIIEH